MSATDSQSQDTYLNITHDATVDGGWSGQLRVVVATSNSAEPLVFVDSDLLGPRRLVLTGPQANALSETLEKAADELIPPHPWDLEARRRILIDAPAEVTRTRANLLRHSRTCAGRDGSGPEE